MRSAASDPDTSSNTVAQRGTTLIEIVITVAVMTIGLLGFFALHFRSFQTSSSSAAMTQAASLAAGLLDSLQAMPYPSVTFSSALAACATKPGPSADPLADLCMPVDYVNVMGVSDSSRGVIKFERSWHVDQPTPGGPIRITARVRYPTEDGRCPACALHKSGFKAITISAVRAEMRY